MKKVFSFFSLLLFAGFFTVSAQNVIHVVKSSADCTNLTVEFSVPVGKVSKLMSMSITPNFTTCNASVAAPTVNFAQVYAKPLSGNTKSAPKILYKKTVSQDGSSTESTPAQDVKLSAGTYVLEISKAPNVEAKLEVYTH